MATNFPTSLDTFTNPNSGNTLDSPSHSIQHSDINDAVEAIEAKIGVGSSTAGSATAGYALVNTSGGTTAYSLLGVSGLSSGTAVANTVLTANGSGGATFAPTTGGLNLLIPSSVAVGSGSGSVSATGTVTFSGASSVSINDVFSATYDNYLVNLYYDLSTGTNVDVNWRGRTAGTDNSTANYNIQDIRVTTTSVTSVRATGQTSGKIGLADTLNPNMAQLLIFSPNKVAKTVLITNTFCPNAGARYEDAKNLFNATTAFDGITIIPSAGNMTGSISCYGYNQ
jgi:hypothetical protein